MNRKPTKQDLQVVKPKWLEIFFLYENSFSESYAYIKTQISDLNYKKSHYSLLFLKEYCSL